MEVAAWIQSARNVSGRLRGLEGELVVDGESGRAQVSWRQTMSAWASRHCWTRLRSAAGELRPVTLWEIMVSVRDAVTGGGAPAGRGWLEESGRRLGGGRWERMKVEVECASAARRDWL